VADVQKPRCRPQFGLRRQLQLVGVLLFVAVSKNVYAQNTNNIDHFPNEPPKSAPRASPCVLPTCIDAKGVKDIAEALKSKDIDRERQSFAFTFLSTRYLELGEQHSLLDEGNRSINPTHFPSVVELFKIKGEELLVYESEHEFVAFSKLNLASGPAEGRWWCLKFYPSKPFKSPIAWEYMSKARLLIHVGEYALDAEGNLRIQVEGLPATKALSEIGIRVQNPPYGDSFSPSIQKD
jgi:hypothetical protein